MRVADPLHEAVDALVSSAERGDWDGARANATRAKALLDQLATEDPEMPLDVWIAEDQEALLARAAIAAIDDQRLETAAELLEVAPDACMIAQPRAAMRALCAGDPERALALLDCSYVRGPLRDRVVELTSRILDRGPWHHRILALSAIGILGDYDALETAHARRTDWANARNLPDDSDLRDYVFVTTCWRRRASHPAFVECAARHGSRLSLFAPPLFDEIVAAARAQLNARGWPYSALSIVADADTRAGRHAELETLAATLSAASSKRASMIRRIVASARERAEPSFEATPAELTVDEAVAIADLGTFELDSTVLTVGDPGYTHQCLHFHWRLLNARPGTWRARVGRSPDEQSSCVFLLAHHVGHPLALEDRVWTDAGSIDVEYATAGIFDCAHYYDESVSKDLPSLRPDEHPWFDLCCARAHNLPGDHDDRGAGVVPFGCVASSGVDGNYSCHAARMPDGTVVAACILFSSEPEDE